MSHAEPECDRGRSRHAQQRCPSSAASEAVAAASPDEIPAPQRLPGWFPAAVVAAGLIASAVLFLVIRAWEDERRAHGVHAGAAAQAALFRARVDGQLRALRTLARALADSPRLDGARFDAVVAPLLADFAEVESVAWAPPGTAPVAVANVAPRAGPTSPAGGDLGARPPWRAAFAQAQAAGQAVVDAPLGASAIHRPTSRLTLVVAARPPPPGAVTASAPAGRGGFVLSTFDVARSFAAAVAGIDAGRVDVRIVGSQRVLHASDAARRPRVWNGGVPIAPAAGTTPDESAVSLTVPIAQQRVRLDFVPSREAASEDLQWRSNFVLASGLLLTAAMAMFLHIAKQRADRVAALIDERTAALQASEAQQRAILDTMVDGLISTDERMRIEMFNRAAERIFGFTAAEARGENVSVLMPPADARRHDLHVESYKRTGVSRIIGIGRELLGRRKDGTLFPIDLALSEARVGGKRVFTSVIRDVTERKQAEERLAARARDAEILHRGTQIAAETESFDDALARCIEVVCEATGWPVGHAYVLAEENREELVASGLWYMNDGARYAAFREATERTAFRRGVGLPGRIWSAGAPVWVRDIQRDENFLRGELCDALALHAAFGFPIRVGPITVAVLEFFSCEIAERDDEFLAVLHTLGEQMGRVLERRRAAEALAAAEERSRLLLESVGDGVYGLDAEGNTIFVNQAATKMLGYSADELVGRSMQALLHANIPTATSCPCGEGDGETSISEPHVHHGDDGVLQRKDGTSFPIEYTSTPVEKDGKVTGSVISFRDISERVQGENELKLAQQALVEANSKLEAMSLTDSLTGLANRRHFDRRLADEVKAAHRSGTPLSVIMADVDQFKLYNDTYGHTRGDACLKRVAECLRGALPRETDFPARYGGEEFGIVLPHTDLDGALLVAERIREAVWERALEHETSEVASRVTMSLGVARLRPDQDASVESLLDRADAALYCAKRDGRNRAVADTPQPPDTGVDSPDVVVLRPR